MKKIILYLILLGQTNLLFPTSSLTGIPSLQEYESIDLRDLYNMYKKDQSLLHNYGNPFLDSRLILLDKRIQIIHYTLHPDNIGKQKALLTALGLFLTGICGGGSFLITQLFLQNRTELKTKKFKQISIPYSWIKKLPKGQFSAKEKRYLKKFSFEDIEARESYQVGNTTYTRWDKRHISQIRADMREEFSYLALQYAIPIKKKELFWQGLSSVATFASAIGVGLYSMYQVFYQEDILKEELEQAQEIYRYLQSIKDSR